MARYMRTEKNLSVNLARLQANDVRALRSVLRYCSGDVKSRSLALKGLCHSIVTVKPE